MLLVAILSGLLLFASFLPLDLPALAWIALVPLLTALHFFRPWQAFVSAQLMGMVFIWFHLRWLLIPGFPRSAVLPLLLYAAAFFGLFGIGFVLLRRTRWPTILIAPILWVALEFLRSHLFFLAIPFFLLGFSQYENLPILQLVSITSVYGVSFLIVLVNTAVAEGIVWGLHRYRGLVDQPPSGRGVLSATGIAFVCVCVVFFWGSQQIRRLDGTAAPLLTAALIQGNIPQEKKWDAKFRGEIVQHYRDLTLEASQDQPDIIIWPEADTCLSHTLTQALADHSESCPRNWHSSADRKLSICQSQARGKENLPPQKQHLFVRHLRENCRSVSQNEAGSLCRVSSPRRRLPLAPLARPEDARRTHCWDCSDYI